jgi:hypothetical protein
MSAKTVELDELLSWDEGLHVLHEQPEPLRRALFLMADALGLPKYLQVPATQWDAFFRRVESLMRSNPYHNFTHVCDVAQVRRGVSTACRPCLQPLAIGTREYSTRAPEKKKSARAHCRRLGEHYCWPELRVAKGVSFTPVRCCRDATVSLTM